MLLCGLDSGFLVNPNIQKVTELNPTIIIRLVWLVIRLLLDYFEELRVDRGVPEYTPEPGFSWMPQWYSTIPQAAAWIQASAVHIIYYIIYLYYWKCLLSFISILTFPSIRVRLHWTKPASQWKIYIHLVNSPRAWWEFVVIQRARCLLYQSEHRYRF